MKPSDVPAGFTAPIAKDAPVWPTTDWWNGFSSPELSSLVVAARSDNLDIAAAAARVMQAQAQTGITAAALFPTLDFNGSAQRSDQAGVNNVATRRTFNTYGASLAASYETDFWGRTRNQVSAARYSAESAIYAQEVIALTVSSDVPNSYFDVLALRQRIDIAKNNVAAAKRILAITEAKVQNGVSSNLELAQQRAQVAGEEAQIPQLEELEREARYALAILLGRPPEGFDVAAKSLDGLTAPPVAPGLPSALLQRRPDIAESEANLLSAHANVDAARAAFFPQIGLTAQGGYTSLALSSLFDPGNLAFTIGASLVQAIFNGGLYSSQSDLAKAQQTELVATYRSTVLRAFSDVETALGQVSSLADQEKLLTDEVSNAQEAFRISELQYREGVIDLLAVLQAQQTLFTSQDLLVQTKLARLQAGVSLYRALGGGWTAAADENIPTRNEFRPL